MLLQMSASPDELASVTLDEPLPPGNGQHSVANSQNLGNGSGSVGSNVPPGGSAPSIPNSAQTGGSGGGQHSFIKLIPKSKSKTKPGVSLTALSVFRLSCQSVLR